MTTREDLDCEMATSIRAARADDFQSANYAVFAMATATHDNDRAIRYSEQQGVCNREIHAADLAAERAMDLGKPKADGYFRTESARWNAEMTLSAWHAVKETAAWHGWMDTADAAKTHILTESKAANTNSISAADLLSDKSVCAEVEAVHSAIIAEQHTVKNGRSAEANAAMARASGSRAAEMSSEPVVVTR